MAELILQLDDQLATRLSNVAREHYEGDSNAVVSDALHLLFLQPIHKDRRRIAKLIDEIRTQVHTAGGITEKEVDQAISGSLKVCKDVDDDKFLETATTGKADYLLTKNTKLFPRKSYLRYPRCQNIRILKQLENQFQA